MKAIMQATFLLTISVGDSIIAGVAENDVFPNLVREYLCLFGYINNARRMRCSSMLVLWSPPTSSSCLLAYFTINTRTTSRCRWRRRSRRKTTRRSSDRDCQSCLCRDSAEHYIATFTLCRFIDSLRSTLCTRFGCELHVTRRCCAGKVITLDFFPSFYARTHPSYAHQYRTALGFDAVVAARM